MRILRNALTVLSIAVLAASMFWPSHSASAADGVTIYYEENAQVELIGPEGERVLVDVYRPSLLSAPPTDQDILLTTHKHTDHYSKTLLDEFKGQKLTNEEGEISTKNVTVKGMASAHDANEEILAEGATNYLFIIDIGGLRVVHFGGFAQKAFTPQQLDAMGKVDVAIISLWNENVSGPNTHTIELMNQLKPRVIIPAHTDKKTLDVAVPQWKSFAVSEKFVHIPTGLSDETRLIFIGYMAPTYQKLWNLPAFESKQSTGGKDMTQKEENIISTFHLGPWEQDIGYSQSVRVGNRILVSGTVGDDTVSKDVESQLKDAYQSIITTLAHDGASLKNVIKETIY